MSAVDEGRRREDVEAHSHLWKFLEYNGYKPENEPLRPSHVKAANLVNGLTPGEVMSYVSADLGVWEIVASKVVDGTKKVMIIFLLTSDGKYSSSAQHFQTLLSSTESKLRSVGGGAMLEEVIVLANQAVTQKKNLLLIMRDYARSLKAKAHFNMYPYRAFSSVVPENPNVSKHELVPQEEAEAEIRKFFLDPSQILQIRATDSPVIWCRGRPGDYVRVWRLSESAETFTPVLRRVI